MVRFLAKEQDCWSYLLFDRWAAQLSEEVGRSSQHECMLPVIACVTLGPQRQPTALSLGWLLFPGQPSSVTPEKLKLSEMTCIT